MHLEDWKIVVDIVESIAKIGAIIVAGIWVLLIYVRNMENKPRAEFNLDIKFQKKIDKYWIVELIAEIENKGKIPQLIENFGFILKSLNENDEVRVSNDEKDRKQLSFPNNLTENRFMGLHRFFIIAPGVREKYTYVTQVPINAEIVHFKAYYEHQIKSRPALFNKFANYILYGDRYKPDGKVSTEITKVVPKKENNNA